MSLSDNLKVKMYGRHYTTDNQFNEYLIMVQDHPIQNTNQVIYLRFYVFTIKIILKK